MNAKKKKVPAAPPVNNAFSNINIDMNKGGPDAETVAAVVMLARAAEANAKAIEATAIALQGQASPSYGIYIAGNK